MNIIQLRDHLNNLLATGIDPIMPVVIPSLDPADDTLSVNELTKLVLRDDERYQYDTEKCAVLHKTGSVLALGSLGNDGWQNQSQGTNRVSETIEFDVEDIASSMEALAYDNKEKIDFDVFHHLPDLTIGSVIAAQDLGHSYVFYKTQTGNYHEILYNGTTVPTLMPVNPKRVKLKPFDGKEFFLKRPSGLIALPSEEAHRRTIEICADLGMEPPKPYDISQVLLKTDFDKAKEV